MKRLFNVFLFLMLLSVTSFAQNSTGGANYYQSLVGTNFPALTAAGADALVYVDDANNNDGVVDGLTNLGYNVTLATDPSNFNALLQSDNYGFVVLFAQGNSAVGEGINVTAIGNYITDGGQMLFCTWTSSDAAIASLFEASITGSTNHTTVTITDPALANGITNPFTISNPGWGVFSIGLSPVGDGEVLATFENSSAAIIRGNGGRTIMLGYLSDAPSSQRQAIFENVVQVVANPVAVPISYYWFIILFGAIGISILFSKRKLIFG